MPSSSKGCRGYSLIELLLVLVIVAILAVASAYMVGNRGSGSVRVVMDELEGTLSGAQKYAVSTGRDVLVATQGDWGGATPMVAAYGDATLGAAEVLLNATRAPSLTLAANETPMVAEAFRVAVNSNGTLQRVHMNAGVVTAATAGWWTTMTGAAGVADITGVAPFNDASTGFKDVLTSSPNLFQGGTTVGSVRISGANKRFVSTFWIEVVSIANGLPLPGGALGLLVVQANSGQIFKFYNPGTLNGNGKWRRI